MLELSRAPYRISTDKAKLELDIIHGYLRRSYWAEGIPRKVLERSLAHSLNFGLYLDAEGSAEQVGFARVVSDYATFAYLADVFVLEPHRGKGLGVWLVEAVVGHPELQGLRTWTLFTKDAHALYRKFGFEPLEQPERAMRRRVPNPYPPENPG